MTVECYRNVLHHMERLISIVFGGTNVTVILSPEHGRLTFSESQQQLGNSEDTVSSLMFLWLKFVF